MCKEECKIELSIYNISKWWSVFSVFKSVSLAIKYDTGLYVILESNTLRKIKEDKIKSKITYTGTSPVGYRNWLVGKIWLDNCIISETRFKDAKEFASEYVKIVGSF